MVNTSHLTPHHGEIQWRRGEQINLLSRAAKLQSKILCEYLFVCWECWERVMCSCMPAVSQQCPVSSVLLPVLVQTPPPCQRRNGRSRGRPAWLRVREEGGDGGGPREHSPGSVVFEAPGAREGGAGAGQAVPGAAPWYSRTGSGRACQGSWGKWDGRYSSRRSPASGWLWTSRCCHCCRWSRSPETRNYNHWVPEVSVRVPRLVQERRHDVSGWPEPSLLVGVHWLLWSVFLSHSLSLSSLYTSQQDWQCWQCWQCWPGWRRPFSSSTPGWEPTWLVWPAAPWCGSM